MVTQRSRPSRSKKLSRLKLIPPPKSVEQLAREQGIDLDAPAPDYVALATAVWPTKKDFENAVRQLREIRNKRSH